VFFDMSGLDLEHTSRNFVIKQKVFYMILGSFICLQLQFVCLDWVVLLFVLLFEFLHVRCKDVTINS